MIFSKRIGRFKNSRTVIAMVCLLTFIHAPALRAADEDFYTWTGIEMTSGVPAAHPFLRNFRYKLFMQGRFGDDSSRFTQGLIRTGLGYAFSEKMTVWLGYDWVPTSRPLALRPFNDHALWQQLSLQEHYSFGTLASRTRFERIFLIFQAVPIPRSFSARCSNCHRRCIRFQRNSASWSGMKSSPT
jgi:hypothetical protein